MYTEVLPRVDFRDIGRHMSRQRYQRGSLKKVGNTRKMWRGRWHVYVKNSDGSETIAEPSTGCPQAFPGKSRTVHTFRWK